MSKSVKIMVPLYFKQDLIPFHIHFRWKPLIQNNCQNQSEVYKQARI